MIIPVISEVSNGFTFGASVGSSKMCVLHAVFSGQQLAVLADDVLSELGVFTDYTDTEGLWITEKESGDTITQTVWTRCTSSLR